MRLGRLARGLPVGLVGLALIGAPVPCTVAGETPSAPLPPMAIAAFDIPARAERTTGELREWDARLLTSPPREEIERGVPELRAALVLLAVRSPNDTTEVSPRDLDDLERQWEQARDRLTGWADQLAKRLQLLEGWLTRLRELDDVWEATATAATHDGLPAVVMREIATVRAGIRDAQAGAKDQRDALLTLASQVGALQGKVADGLAAVAAATARMHGDIFATDAPPLWRAFQDTAAHEPFRTVLAETWHQNREQLHGSLRTDRAQLVVALLVLLLLLTATLTVRRHAGAWPADDPALTEVYAIAARPFSAAVIVAMLVRWMAAPAVATVFGEISTLLVTVPLLCMLWDRLRGKLRTVVPMVGVVLLIVSVRRILPVTSVEARVLLATENLLLGAWALWAFRPHLLARIVPSPQLQRGLLSGARVASALLAISLVANLAGNVSLAIVVTRAVLGATFLGLLVSQTRRVVEGLALAALQTPATTMPSAVARHASALRNGVLTATRLAAAAAWVAGTLHAAGVLAVLAAAVGDVLGARLEIGALSLSAKDVLAFGLTVWVSLLAARVMRTVLEDDLLPRMDLPRGVPSAVSTAANYTVLLVGFLLALSAAGLDLGRVTIVAGAFGVGIGFGLQNVVNNFVSGLILLFERPIRLGDVIEFGGVAGWVRRIGIRSTTIETFDGAEVIVPNAQLVAERVTNWTFSASQRRIELRVGVAYRSDPTAVLALLERVAAAQDEVLRQPPPQALFVGFGASTLDFVIRAWTGRYDIAPVVLSKLGVAVHAALNEAGIPIPFPQTELHLRSIDPRVQTALTDRS